MYYNGNARLFYLLLIIIGSSGLGLGIHSASADCGDAPAPNVNYNGCDLTGASFVGADLRGATFVGATIDDADFTNAKLMTSDFSGIDTHIGSNTIFNGANLTRAIFQNANVDEGTLSFQAADLHYVDFSGTDLSNSELTSQADITGANFSGAFLFGTDFTQSIMKNVIFSPATQIQNSIFNGVDFSGSQITHVNLSNNNFEGVNFLNANLTGTSLANTDLTNAVIGLTTIPPNFQNADLSYVDFTDSTLSPSASFTGAILTGANLHCTGNPICITSNNPSPVIHFDQISFTGGTSLGQVNATAWKFSAASALGANVQYTGVYATVGSTTIQQGSYLVCTPNSYTFPLGTTQVTCIATDPSNPNNTSTSYFYIIIADNIPPTVIPPSSPVIAEATSPSGANVVFHVTATDVVHGSLTPVCIPGNGTTFALGSTPVTCTATDPDGNSGSATFPVTVQDTTGPSIATGNVTAEATGPLGALVTYHATATDLVDGHVTPTCTPALNGTTFVIGSTTLSCSATDSHHNTSTKPLVVKVQDTTTPSITAPIGITTAATGTLTQVVLGSPTGVSDLVDPNPLVTNDAPVAGFPVGETDVKWTATDHSGNAKSVIQIIIITSTVPVSITAPSDITTQATGPLTQVSLGTPTFTDPLDPHPAITNDAPPGGFPVTTTVVSWYLVDKYGNTANSAQTVIVVDTTGPSIATGNVTAEATGPLGALVTYHATATDLVDGHVTPTCTPALNGTTFVIGSTTLSCSATDSHHNTSTKPLVVKVQDTTGPVITLPPLPIIIEAVNQNGAPVPFSVTASDIVTGTAPVTCTPPSGTLIFGQQTIVCQATDKATPPNTSSASFLVTVHDTTPPTITAPPSITQIQTGTLTPVSLGTPTVHDAVDPVPVTTNNAPVAGFPVGTTIVTWTATDASGNKATATQTVTILPNNTPGKVNGGGSFGKDINFNMNIQSKDGLFFKGHLDFDDKHAKIDLDSKTITGLFVDSTGTKANFTGTASLNGHSGYTFKAYVIDNGNPGKNDLFQIAIFDSTGHQVYANSGKLTEGNLHVNHTCDIGDDPHDADPRDKWSNSHDSRNNSHDSGKK